MTKTVDQIRVRALQELRVLANGQAMAAEDAEAVDVAASAGTLSALRHVDLTGDVLADAIDDTWFIPFSKYVASHHAAIFGVGPAQAEALRSEALGMIDQIADRVRPKLSAGTGLGWITLR